MEMENLERIANLHREMGDVYDKLYDSLTKNQDQAERIRYLESRLSEEIDNRHEQVQAPYVPTMTYEQADHQAGSFAGEVGRILIHIGRTPELQTQIAEISNQIIGIKAIKASYVCELKAAKHAYEIWVNNIPAQENEDYDLDEDNSED